MKKWILLALISAMSIGVAADNAHAIFGGRAWRVTARQEGFGFFGLRLNKSGRAFRTKAHSGWRKEASASPVKQVGPSQLQVVRDAVDDNFLDIEIKDSPYEYHEMLDTHNHGYQTRGGQ